MEIKGEDFLKKVQLKQEETEIENRLNEIKNAQAIYEEQQNSSNTFQQKQNETPNLDKELQMQEEQEYSDIMLGKTSNNSSNNKNRRKYIVLILILIILFLLTIAIIRLFNNDSNEDSSFSKTKNDSSNKQTILENENIEEQYQKIINEKLKNIKEEKEKETYADNDSNLNLEKIEEKEKEIQPVKENRKPDVFNVKKVALKEPKIKIKKEVVVKKEPKKQIPKKTTNSNKTITQKPKGTFIQVGAFTKMPEDKYLTSITKKGFKYKIYKVSINNRIFHKVLIGPYNSRGQAKLAIDNIKKELNISGAFILKF